MKIKGNRQYFFQLFTLRDHQPVSFPSENIEEVIGQLTEKVNDGWKEHQIKIGSFTKREIIYSNFRHSHTYVKFSTILSPQQKRKLRKLKRQIKKRMVDTPQEQMDYLVAFVLGCKRLGCTDTLFEDQFNDLLKRLRKSGYPEKKIIQLTSKAQNKYKFGFEAPRIKRRVEVLKEKKE